MYLLTNLLLWGDIATNLLGEARAKSGLNETQAQICLLLSGFRGRSQDRPIAMTPAEISRALCSPGARIHNQISVLMAKQLLAHADARNAASEKRSRPYTLTALGLRRASIYEDYLIKAEATFVRLITKKDVEALDRLSARLTQPVSVGAFDSIGVLKKACAARTVLIAKRWS